MIFYCYSFSQKYTPNLNKTQKDSTQIFSIIKQNSLISRMHAIVVFNFIGILIVQIDYLQLPFVSRQRKNKQNEYNSS